MWFFNFTKINSLKPALIMICNIRFYVQRTFTVTKDYNKRSKYLIVTLTTKFVILIKTT